VGFASENNTQRENPSELLSRLENYAKGQVAEYIQVTMRSEALLTLKEEGDRFQQSFSSISHSANNFVLSGLKVETLGRILSNAEAILTMDWITASDIR